MIGLDANGTLAIITHSNVWITLTGGYMIVISNDKIVREIKVLSVIF